MLILETTLITLSLHKVLASAMAPRTQRLDEAPNQTPDGRNPVDKQTLHQGPGSDASDCR
jgi:hypothetical protein